MAFKGQYLICLILIVNDVNMAIIRYYDSIGENINQEG